MSILKISLLFFAVLATSVAASGCPSSGGSFEEELRERTFSRPVSQARADGVPVYWLGETVPFAGGNLDIVEFSYPAAVAGSRVNGIDMEYFREGSLPGRVAFTSMSKSEAPDVEQALAALPGARVDHISIDGREAELFTIMLGGQEHAYQIAMELEDAFVVAATSRELKDGVQANPLMSVAALIRAMQNIQAFTEDLD